MGKKTNQAISFGRWLKISLLVLLIPIAVSIALYSVLFVYLKDNINKANQNSFTNVVNVVDDKFQNLYLDLIYTANSESFRKAVLTPEDRVSEITNADKIGFQSELKRIKQQYNFVGSVIVYFNDALIICDNNVLTIEGLYSVDMFSIGIGVQTLKQQLKTEHNKHLVLSQDSMLNFSLLYQTVYFGASSQFRATALVTLNNYRLTEFVEDLMWTNNQSITLSDGSENNFCITAEEFSASKSGISTLEKPSNYYDLTYRLGISNGIDTQLYAILVTVVAISALVSIVLGMWLTVRNTRGHFNPLKQINKILDESAEENRPESMGHLTVAIEKIIEQNRRLRTSIDSNRDVMVSDVINRLLRNLPFPVTVRELCKEYDLPFLGVSLHF